MILVTGANGLIGRALVQQLSEERQAVRAHGRDKTALSLALPGERLNEGDSGLQLSAFDLTTASAQQLLSLCKDAKAVVHCAALVHQPDAAAATYEKANLQTTRALAEAARASGVASFVFLSTSAVYGEGPFESADERHPLDPQTPYAESKRRCEDMLAELMPAKQTIIFRPGLVFGPGDRGNMRSLIKQIRRGLYFHIAGNSAKKSVICSADLAQAIRMSMENLPAGFHVLNAANPQPVSVIDLGNAIAHSCSRQAPPVVPEKLVKKGAAICEAIFGSRAVLSKEKMRKLMTTTTLDVSALTQSTGFAPQLSLADALELESGWLAKKH